MYAPKFRHWMTDHERLIECRAPAFLSEIREMADAARAWLDSALPEVKPPIYHDDLASILRQLGVSANCQSQLAGLPVGSVLNPFNPYGYSANVLTGLIFR